MEYEARGGTAGRSIGRARLRRLCTKEGVEGGLGWDVAWYRHGTWSCAVGWLLALEASFSEQKVREFTRSFLGGGRKGSLAPNTYLNLMLRLAAR